MPQYDDRKDHKKDNDNELYIIVHSILKGIPKSKDVIPLKITTIHKELPHEKLLIINTWFLISKQHFEKKALLIAKINIWINE